MKNLKFALLAAFGASLLASCGDGATSAPIIERRVMSGVLSTPGATVASAQASLTRLDTRVRSQPWLQPHAKEVVPGEYLVKFKPSVSAQAATLNAAGVTLSRARRGAFGFTLYRASSDSLRAASQTNVVAALSARADVEGVVPNYVLHAYAVPSDPLHAVQWDQGMTRLEAAWNVTTGRSIPVAVVDTGIVDHPDLRAKLLPGFDFVADADNAGDWDGIDDDPTDEGNGSDYHGSHVAGIIAASTNNGEGIAGASWGAKIVPVRVLGASGGSLNDIMNGIAWAAGEDVDGAPLNPNPAKVINLSLGGTAPCEPPLQSAFDDLAANGVTVVVAAGNEDVDASTSFPANCANVITVGAVGPDGARAPYSNFGSYVDVMAPGGNMDLGINVGGKILPGGVYSTILDEDGEPVYAPYNGTSMAAPQVAGLVALLKSVQPNLTPSQIFARLKATSHSLSSAACGVTNGCGAGIVDAAAFLGGAAQPSPTPIPTPPTSALKTLVFALYLRDGRTLNDVDYNKSTWEEVSGDKLRSLYKVRDLQPGVYAAVAWQDLDGDLTIDDAEPIGMYPTTVNLTGGDRSNVDIDLEPFEAAAVSDLNVSLAKSAMRALLTRATP
ncbi:S8 family peptidase [Deinococcus yavapaiensis]|uniref:Serine protease n=1 Tax=Deinococcus yavapaiensis KR-236 TaxID=694435 RepID=A0A318SF64_9DEIO|nr:S8 family peptidase [Deinococcus yavapaiensis]PYE55352.1 serine protease [Deinococcus yavapaiensis KR-236]